MEGCLQRVRDGWQLAKPFLCTAISVISPITLLTLFILYGRFKFPSDSGAPDLYECLANVVLPGYKNRFAAREMDIADETFDLVGSMDPMKEFLWPLQKLVANDIDNVADMQWYMARMENVIKLKVRVLASQVAWLNFLKTAMTKVGGDDGDFPLHKNSMMLLMAQFLDFREQNGQTKSFDPLLNFLQGDEQAVDVDAVMECLGDSSNTPSFTTQAVKEEMKFHATNNETTRHVSGVESPEWNVPRDIWRAAHVAHGNGVPFQFPYGGGRDPVRNRADFFRELIANDYEGIPRDCRPPRVMHFRASDFYGSSEEEENDDSEENQENDQPNEDT